VSSYGKEDRRPDGRGRHDLFPAGPRRTDRLSQLRRAAMTELHIPATPQLRSGDQIGNLDDSVYSRLLKERIVLLGSEVTDQVANRICAQLLLLAAEDPDRDINLWINSPGGSVYSGMAIYDTMQFIDNDVSTVAMGMAASMGQLLLCAGTAGKRYALPHARIMMHQPSGGMGGTASDIAIQAEQMLYTKRMFQERVAFHTGQSAEQIEADSDRDRWFTAQEAKDYGFIDKVISGAKQVPAGAGTLT
jgi:ATP-dependent Clp protease protease subunit